MAVVSLNDAMLAFFRRGISVTKGGSTPNTPVQAADITVDSTAGGVVLAAANEDRSLIVIENTGTAPMRYRFSGNPSTTQGFQLAAGAMHAWSAPDCPQGAVKGIREGASSTTASVMEV